MNWCFRYKDIIIQQHENVSEVFSNLFLKVKPKRILEIGTAYGGLSILLRDILDNLNMTDTSIRTYDIFKHHSLNYENIDFKIENIFNDQYSELISDDVTSYIKQEGVSIVLCDGHHKKEEFNVLSKYIKNGDIIMAHDYSPSIEYFEEYIKDNIWDWCEIVDLDIEQSVLNYNLKPFMFDEFKDVVWCCKIK
jgi:cephalosporin hydroxylase